MIALSDIPSCEYFLFKNIWTGSRGDFRFKIVPTLSKEDPENNKLTTYTYARLCFEKAETLATLETPLTPEGVEQTAAWLDEQCEAYYATQEAGW